MNIDSYLARIHAVFPEMPLDDVVINRDGMVNVAIMLGDEVYRFALSQSSAIEALKRETAVLNLLVDQITKVHIPIFQVFADDFVRYRFIPGEPLTRAALLMMPTVESDRVLGQLAHFLQELHSTPVDQVRSAEIGTSAGTRTREDWLTFYETVERELFPLMYRVTRDHIKAHFAPVLENPDFLTHEPALIHDDLAQYHLLFDSVNSRLNGVIDFGTAGLGDPAADYGILINVYGENIVARMAAHDARLPSLIDRARFYAGTYELQWLLSGLHEQSWDIMTAHLDRARDSRPYGSRL